MKLHYITSSLIYIIVMCASQFYLLNSDYFSSLLFVTNGMSVWYICCKANFESALLQLVAFIYQFPFYGDFEVEPLVYVLRFLFCKGWKKILYIYFLLIFLFSMSISTGK